MSTITQEEIDAGAYLEPTAAPFAFSPVTYALMVSHGLVIEETVGMFKRGAHWGVHQVEFLAARWPGWSAPDPVIPIFSPTIVNPVIGETLVYDGTKWVNSEAQGGADLSSLPAATLPTPDNVIVKQSGVWASATWQQLIDWIGVNGLPPGAVTLNGTPLTINGSYVTIT